MIDIQEFYPKSRHEWREWLIKNHTRIQSVWLIYYKQKSGISSITYRDAVDEALCFGWIDSKAQKIDESSYRQLFTKRKSTSVWSKVNKGKVEELIKDGLMTESGFKSIEIAKENGSWIILDDAENLILPESLIKEFTKSPEGYEYFNSLSRTTKRNILQWITLAKKGETKEKRIKEVVDSASSMTVPKQFRINN